MMKRKATNWIVIHCSATRAIQNIGAKEIRQWHKDKGWSDIGYHYVIRRDGTVDNGKGREDVGAHVAGHNSDSLGICLVGGLSNKTWQPENNFTKAQFTALEILLGMLLVRYPNAKILGHRDFPKVAKACPCFDARPWAKEHGFPT